MGSYNNKTKQELIREIERLKLKYEPESLQQTPKKPQKKVFDFDKYFYRDVALKVSYIGWDYYGLASQETDTVPTIESLLFGALERTKLIKDKTGFSRCGRTDKGVSSFGQIIRLRLRSNFTQKDFENGLVDNSKELPYLTMLNANLPDDIRVVAWSPVSADFDARFSCHYRRYKYLFHGSSLDIAAMQEAASKYLGSHDFRNFCKIDPSKNITNYERTVLDSRIFSLADDPEFHGDANGFYVFQVKGTAFLWHQVRSMMSILLLVGKGYEKPQVVDYLLDMSQHKDKGRPIYDIAADLPLVLYECGYDEQKWPFNWICDESGKEHQRKLISSLLAQWETAALKQVLIRGLISSINSESTVYDVSKPAKYVPMTERNRCANVASTDKRLKRSPAPSRSNEEKRQKK